MHAASHSQTPRRSQTRTCVAQAASCVCSLCRITYPSGHKALSSRVRVTAFERPGNSASFQYDSNTNRLSALQKTIADSDLDGDYEAGAGTADVRTESQSAQLIAADSNRMLSLSTFTTRVGGTRTLSNITKTDEQQLDAAGNLLRDGQKTYSYDPAGRISKVSINNSTTATGTQTASVVYKHNALGQRVFKSEPQGDANTNGKGPDPAVLGAEFAAWLDSGLPIGRAAGAAWVSAAELRPFPRFVVANTSGYWTPPSARSCIAPRRTAIPSPTTKARVSTNFGWLYAAGLALLG